ncbi:MAG: methyl-accepting chemotaxis protein [Gammaproteobacteria bacterium]|jgi:methyl-accepting chemotaxis protein
MPVCDRTVLFGLRRCAAGFPTNRRRHSHLMSRGANIRVFVAMPIVHEHRLIGAVMLSRTPLDISKALYAQRGLLLGSAVGLLALVFAMSLFTSITIRRPIAALIEQSRRAVRGERGAVIPLSKPVTADIAVLSAALAKMANSLEERANTIQRSGTTSRTNSRRP